MGLLAALSLAQPKWTSVAGTGTVLRWSVNDTSNLVKVKSRTGAERQFALPQFKFSNGDLFLISLLPLTSSTLLVTHEQGAYIVNSKGRVTAMIGKNRPCQVLVQNGVPRIVNSLSGPFEEPPGNRLVAMGWNGSTISATYKESEYSYFVLLTPTLRRRAAFVFADGPIDSVTSEGRTGWLVKVNAKPGLQTFRVENSGAIRTVREKRVSIFPNHFSEFH